MATGHGWDIWDGASEVVGISDNNQSAFFAVLCLLTTLLLSACATPHKVGSQDDGHRIGFTGKAHHIGDRFRNAGDYTPSPGGSWLKLAFDPYRKHVTVPKGHFLSHEAAVTGLRKSATKSASITWIGHSTFLMRIGKRWLLTDPVFSSRVSPVPPFGPKRLVRPGLKLKDLPKIDVIILSHNHFDHTDFPSLVQLAKLNPNAQVFVPLKNAGVVKRAGFRHITEADWFETHGFAGMQFTAVPAVHSSRRGIADLNKSLWSGWSIRAAGRKIYFAGDTAKGSFIHEIRRRLGTHELALMPIGAYSPPELEKGHHATPEESVEMARQLGARHIIPTHWGTFALSKEPISEQRNRFIHASKHHPKPHVLRIGQTIAMPH